MVPRSLFLIVVLLLVSPKAWSESVDPAELVVQAIDHWRGSTSYVEAHMTVHRPLWQREMSLHSWTKGSNRSLVRFTAPVKDAGSASLTVDNSMWSYAPKISKVIKIPPSMMGQSWMGSDFSYKDLARSDDIIEYYNHKLLEETNYDGQLLYHVESIPKEDAPVVWGKELLKIREDYIIIEHDFYDQDMELVKQLRASDIRMMGGRMYPGTIRMTQVEEKEKWTEVRHTKVSFGHDLSDRIFTQAHLRNPR